MARAMNPAPLELEEAQAALLALAAPLLTETVAITAAIGRFLTAPLTARRTQPAADLSSMDGYAVAPGDLAGPWRVIGESAAGHPLAGTITPGTAARISTGALLPAGAGAVIIQEDMTRSGDDLTLTGAAPVPSDRYLRRKGLDFRADDALLPAGTRIGPAQLALAISAGYTQLDLCRRPRLAILDSGDELAPLGVSPDVHQIPASNGAMLAALASGLPCEIQRLGPVADSMAALAAALDRADDADLIVTSGGVSVGDHDLIRPALEAWGAKIDFWRIAIKPGKPLLVATRTKAGGGIQLIIGLPGNPVSSYVTAFLFLLPLIRSLLGSTTPLPRRIAATLAAPLGPGGLRREFLRASWDGETITAQGLQDSGALSSLAHSNALVDRPAQAPELPVGTQVSAYLLENGGIA
jgi:molybdopterin molybdotransferase